MAKISKIEGDYELVTEKVTLEMWSADLSYKLFAAAPRQNYVSFFF